MKIVPGTASQALGARIAAELSCELVACEFKRFPDGELYTRITGDVEGEHAVIVQSIRSDSDLVALLQLLDAAEGASKITAVIPYLGYARQDKRFKPGEAVSIRAIARSISYGAPALDTVYVVNVHDHAELRYFQVAVHELDASPLIGNYIMNMGIEPASVVVIAPDEGAAELARAVAAPYGLDYDVMEKKRLTGDEVEIKPKELSIDIDGKNIVIVDDIISTGGTIAEATKRMRERNAGDIYVACVHGLFVQNAILRMLHAGVKEIISTDTVESVFSRVSIAELVAKELERGVEVQ